MGLAMAAVLAAGTAAAAPVETKGKIEQVTVYRGQALVTRDVEVDAPAGTVDLIVADLPEQIVPGTLYATGTKDVLIRAVRYRTRAVEDEPRPEVRQIDAQLEQLAQQLRQMEAADALQKQKESYLTNLEKFASAKSATELDKGTLKVDALVSLTEFLFKQRGQLTDEALKRKEEALKLKDKMALLQRQRQKLTSGSTRTAREAVLFLEKKGAAKAAVQLNYLVTGASWMPSYTLRCAALGQKVELEYNALVQQMSGEDWEGVTLKLSTASPSMGASSPILTPLWVTLAPAAPGQAPQPAQTFAGYIGGQRLLRENIREALQQRSAKAAGPDQVDMDWAVNAEANRLQIMDLLAAKDVILSGQDLAAAAAEVLSVSYELPGRISLPSRSDQQMIQIATMKLDGKFYYLATPVLTPYVYQQADVVNTSGVALLAGAVNTYMNGQFTGSVQIPMVAKGQQFTVGFGVDSQLRVKRELADKTDKIQGGNRVQTFTYRLLVNNYKDQQVTVRLLDRLPDPRGADVKITVGEMSQPLSKDELYLQTLRKVGILRWEIDVPAKASGAQAKKVEYAYTVEFDRNMGITEPAPAQIEQEKRQFKQDLMRMQMTH
jgi:hypothetical protein